MKVKDLMRNLETYPPEYEIAIDTNFLFNSPITSIEQVDIANSPVGDIVVIIPLAAIKRSS